MRIMVTKKQGGFWRDIEDVLPPYAAIRFVQYNGQIDTIWDCLLRRWR